METFEVSWLVRSSLLGVGLGFGKRERGKERERRRSMSRVATTSPN